VDNLGYVFHRLEEDVSLGKNAQLEVNIYAQPTGEHYDPQQASFPVATGEHIESLKVTHPWHGQKQYRVCAGRVRLLDWREKVVEAATYGGDLNITLQETYTHCSLTSSAPIIELMDNVISPEARLVYEIEVLLAKRRAECHDDKVFEQRLAAVDPLMLFMVSLATVEQKFTQIPSTQRGVRYRAARKIIQQTIRLLQERGVWPTSLPTLTELI
jgi:hypothetical protein